MPKAKRDVLRYIDESIEYERGNNTAAPLAGTGVGSTTPRRTLST
jgi:hypothetical protein